MIGDILKALGQLPDPRFLGVLAKSVLWAGAAFAVLFLPLWGLTSLLDGLLGGWIGIDFGGWLGGTLSFLAAGLWLWLASILMFPIAAVIVGFYLETIASAVDARHYPQLGPPRAAGVKEAVGTAIGFTLALIGVNLLALLVYPFTGPFAPLLFWAVNGYLLGREYFEIVAARRMEPREMRALRGRVTGEIWLLGTLMVLPLTVPVLNLLIPVIGVAAFAHFFHRVRAREASTG